MEAELNSATFTVTIHREGPLPDAEGLESMLNFHFDQVEVTEGEALAIDARQQVYEVNVAEFNPAPGVRIVLSLPSTAPREAFDHAAEGLKRHFPDHPIIVMHDNAKLEAEDEAGDSSGLSSPPD
jgi:hypothetical protein